MTVSSSRLKEIIERLYVLSSRLTGPRCTKIMELIYQLEAQELPEDTTAISTQLTVAASWDLATADDYLTLAHEFDDGIDKPVPDKLDDPYIADADTAGAHEPVVPE